MENDLVRLIGHSAALSVMAIGGIYVILGELQRLVVVEYGWLTAAQFTGLFALAQAAPGPNTVFFTLIGGRVAGLAGALAASAGFVLPSVLIAGLFARAWLRLKDRRWFATLRRGLVPLTLGLLVSSALLLLGAVAAAHGATGLIVAAVACAAFLLTRTSPVVILAGAALLGATGLLPL